MAVTISEIRRTSLRTIRVKYSSDLGGTPTFRLFRDGLFAAATKLTEWEFTVLSGDTPVFEVLDDANAQPSTAFPARWGIGWDGRTDADHYLVEEFVSSVWTLRSRVKETGAGYYSFESRRLEDGVQHKFRVIAVGANGESSVALEFTDFMVRHPDPPALVTTYDSGTKRITVDNAP